MALNPVEKQMAKLCKEWEYFANEKNKRLLIWEAPENSKRMVHCFFESQKYQTEYSTGDLFIVFETPFEHSVQYSRDLKEFLKGTYEASIDDLKKQKINTDWSFDPKKSPHTATGFFQAMRNFGSQFNKDIGILVVVLSPSAVSEQKYFQDWLLRGLETELPDRLRITLIDSIENPQHKKLVDKKHPRILPKALKIDTWNIAQATFSQETAPNPSAVYRNLMMGVMALLDKGDAEKVNYKARDALKFARKQGWKDQEVSLRLMVAGAYLKEKKHQQAAQVYQQALKFNQKNLKGNPLQYKLALQCLFGEAATHLAAGKTEKAVKCYQQSAKICEKNDDFIHAIESDRMTGFCFQKMSNAEESAKHSLNAFKRCEGLSAEQKSTTTGSVAAMDLLRSINNKKADELLDIRIKMLTSSGGLLDQAERKAAQLEKKPSKSIEKKIVTVLAEQSKIIEKHAEAEVSKSVSESEVSFQQVFRKGQEIFGADWPIKDPLALPVGAEQIEAARKANG